jgi:hypothetical protein
MPCQAALAQALAKCLSKATATAALTESLTNFAVLERDFLSHIILLMHVHARSDSL